MPLPQQRSPMVSADDFGAIGMPVSPHRSGREFTLGMLVCEADPFHRSAALPLSAESSRLGSRCRAWL